MNQYYIIILSGGRKPPLRLCRLVGGGWEDALRAGQASKGRDNVSKFFVTERQEDKRARGKTHRTSEDSLGEYSQHRGERSYVPRKG